MRREHELEKRRLRGKLPSEMQEKETRNRLAKPERRQKRGSLSDPPSSLYSSRGSVPLTRNALPSSHSASELARAAASTFPPSYKNLSSRDSSQCIGLSSTGPQKHRKSTMRP